MTVSSQAMRGERHGCILAVRQAARGVALASLRNHEPPRADRSRRRGGRSAARRGGSRRRRDARGDRGVAARRRAGGADRLRTLPRRQLHRASRRQPADRRARSRWPTTAVARFTPGERLQAGGAVSASFAQRLSDAVAASRVADRARPRPRPGAAVARRRRRRRGSGRRRRACRARRRRALPAADRGGRPGLRRGQAAARLLRAPRGARLGGARRGGRARPARAGWS